MPDTPAPALSEEGRQLIEAAILLHPGFGDRRGIEFHALSAYVAGLEAGVARLQSTLAMPTHMLVPRALPTAALKAAERHCDWSSFHYAWGAVLNWIEADAAQRGRAAEGGE